MGSVSVHGVAGLCSDPRLELFLPHLGHGHLKAADVMAASQGTDIQFEDGVIRKACKTVTHLVFLSVVGLM